MQRIAGIIGFAMNRGFQLTIGTKDAANTNQSANLATLYPRQDKNPLGASREGGSFLAAELKTSSTPLGTLLKTLDGNQA